MSDLGGPSFLVEGRTMSDFGGPSFLGTRHLYSFTPLFVFIQRAGGFPCAAICEIVSQATILAAI
jgi:hypothetical protein